MKDTYEVEFNIYHGTTECNALIIKNSIKVKELFFTSCLARAKSYSDGTIIYTSHSEYFKYLNDAKKFVRDLIKKPFIDYIHEGVNTKHLRIKKFKVVFPSSGQSEIIHILKKNRCMYWAEKPSPCRREKTKDYIKLKLHKTKDFN